MRTRQARIGLAWWVWGACWVPGLAAQDAARADPVTAVALRRTATRTSSVPVAPPTLQVGRAATEVRIDGVGDDQAWASASVASGFVQTEPAEGRPVSEPTEVRVLHDGQAIYVLAHLGDGTPERIEARLGRRDDEVHADWFYVMVDSYRDRRTAFAFGVSASGVQRDWRILGDGQQQDAGWDAVWESAARVGPDGWTVEMRVPLSQLRFVEGVEAWGLNFARRIARRNEWAYWAPIPAGSQYFVSLFGELRGVAALSPARRVEILPYTVARLTREPGDAENPFHAPNMMAGAVGADVRVGLGPALTLSATLNPDFGQVEADPAVVNLTAFETFQEERRPFFVEGSDMFQTSWQMAAPFFYSRRIGRTPQLDVPGEAAWADAPSATTILGAVKLTGRTESGWSVGVLDAVTPRERARFVTAAGTRDRATVEPLANYTVARVARELNQGRTGFGVLTTGTLRRLDEAGLSTLRSGALATSLDGWHRFGGATGNTYQMSFAFQGSQVRGDSTAIALTQRAPGHYFQRPDADHLEYDPSRTSLSGWTARGQIWKRQGSLRGGIFLQAISPGFEISDLGFNPQQDVLATNAWMNWWDFTPGRHLRQWNVGTMASVGATFGRERRWVEQMAQANATFLNFWQAGVWLGRSYSGHDPVALRGGPALRTQAGWNGGFEAASDGRRPVNGRAMVHWGVEDDAGGWWFNLRGAMSLRASERVSLSAEPELDARRSMDQWAGRATGPDGPQPVVGRLEQRTLGLGLRVDYTFSARLTFQLYTRPFLASGRYSDFREVTDARASAFGDRFHTFPSERTVRSDGQIGLDRDGDGQPDLSVSDPDFNTRTFQLNAVLRWEYRPGSALYAVWTQDRSASDRAPMDVRADARVLWNAPARNVFVVKASWWMGG